MNIQDLKSPVFLDTAVYIYLLENNKDFSNIAAKIFDQISQDKLRAFTSVITVSEIMVKPYKIKSEQLIIDYQEFLFGLPNHIVLPLDIEAALIASEIRADYNLKFADSCQLSLAKKNNCNIFLTNDKQLKTYKDLNIVCLADIDIS